MHSRFYVLTQAFRSSRPWARAARPTVRHRISQYVCKSCRHNFSTSSILRKTAEVTKNASKQQKYPRQLVIYDAGEMRSTFVVFWKATAIFQFGVACVWFAPLFYKNENQPDKDVRLLQTVGIVVLGAMPVVAMSYLTAPFVKRVAMEIPETARRSRDALMNFTRKMPETTRLEFTTLRAYPFERNTGMVLSELRALPPQKGRFANIELPKTKEWRQTQKKKPIYMRFWEVLAEPRFKFYVKEGRSYTVKTGVPGVWENVAMAIQQRTLKEAADKVTTAAKEKMKATGSRNLVPRRPVRPVTPAMPVKVTQPVVPKLKRQTLRPPLR